MMRVLVDQEALDWDAAWWICERVFAYTNHTVLPEALEAWSKELMGRVLPRHLQIIEEIDRRFRAVISAAHPGDQGKIQRLSIIDDHAQTVRMANLAIVGSHSVNGVAATALGHPRREHLSRARRASSRRSSTTRRTASPRGGGCCRPIPSCPR